MNFNTIPFVRVVKRLSETIGYLELGLPRRAIRCLDELGDPGPFAAVAGMLRREAVRFQGRPKDAPFSFEDAARSLPAPQSRSEWLLLSRLYRQVGDTGRAVETLARARGATPQPKTRPSAD
ncbi:MAG TPA: hypothetical protein VMY42_15675 [Thermoguttaceae bacterium]|nr:hypothetical protein [Thermoguttaceae bacterium]